MKKILFLTPHVPSDMAGGAKFTKSLLRELGKHYSVDLIYFRYPNDVYFESTEGVTTLRIVRNNSILKILRCLFCIIYHPIFSVRYSMSLIDYLKKIDLSSYEVVFLDHSQMFVFARFFNKIKEIVMMSHDVMKDRFRNNFILERKWVVWSERRLMSQKNISQIFTFSNRDVQTIKKTYDITSVSATSFFIEDAIIMQPLDKIESYYVFFGNWSRKDNWSGLEWFYDVVYPIVGEEIKVKIIGGGLSEVLKEKINRIDPTAEILGFVENPYSIISSANAVLAPVFSGAGVKVKVIESLACGIPVIGTEIAFEGIEIENSDFLIRVKSASDFKKALLQNKPSLNERNVFKSEFINEYQSQNAIMKYLNGLFIYG